MLHQTSDIPIKPFELAETQFNTGRFHIMDIVFRRWATLLQETLYAEMGMMLDISAENVEKMRFGKLLDSVEEQPIYIFETLNNGRGFLLVEKPFFDLSLNGKVDKTSEELSLVKMMKENRQTLLKLVSTLIDCFEKSWKNIAEVELKLNRVTIYPRRANVMLPYENCFSGRIQLIHEDLQTSIQLCMPYAALVSVLRPLENKKIIEPESIGYYFPHVKDNFKNLLENSEYSVVAELGKADLREAKGKLEEGQILPLLNKDGLATIRINGTPALQGSTGESSGHYSVQVIRGAEDKKPSAIQQKKKFKQLAWPTQ